MEDPVGGCLGSGGLTNINIERCLMILLCRRDCTTSAVPPGISSGITTIKRYQSLSQEFKK